MSDAGHDDEFLPFLVYRIDGDQMECALWRLEEGGSALTMFLTEDSADKYRAAGQLGPEWKTFQPGRQDLLQILRRSHTAGIAYAVLDPDNESARRIFDVAEVLKNA